RAPLRDRGRRLARVRLVREGQAEPADLPCRARARRLRAGGRAHGRRLARGRHRGRSGGGNAGAAARPRGALPGGGGADRVARRPARSARAVRRPPLVVVLGLGAFGLAFSISITAAYLPPLLAKFTDSRTLIA